MSKKLRTALTLLAIIPASITWSVIADAIGVDPLARKIGCFCIGAYLGWLA